MIPTSLYVHVVLYDAINDIVFDDYLYINKIEIKYRNKVHNNVNDLDEIKYSGKLKNIGDDGIVLLGAL